MDCLPSLCLYHHCHSQRHRGLHSLKETNLTYWKLSPHAVLSSQGYNYQNQRFHHPWRPFPWWIGLSRRLRRFSIQLLWGFSLWSGQNLCTTFPCAGWCNRCELDLIGYSLHNPGKIQSRKDSCDCTENWDNLSTYRIILQRRFA